MRLDFILRHCIFSAIFACTFSANAKEHVELTPFGSLRLEQQADIYRRCVFPSGGVRKLVRYFSRPAKSSASHTEGIYNLKQGLDVKFSATLQKKSTNQYIFSSN